MDYVWKETKFIVYLQDNKDNMDACLKSILTKALYEDLSRVKIHPEDTAYVFSTSGSTGKPKLVEKSHFALVNKPALFVPKEDEELPLIYCDRPFGWAGGNPTTFLLANCAHIFCGSFVALRGRDMEAIWDIIEIEKCTHAALIPYHIYDLIRLKAKSVPDKEHYKLKNISVAGQIVNDSVMEVVGTFADSIKIAYGSTEMYNISVTKNHTLGDRFETGFVGKPMCGYEVKIVGENEDTVPLGEIGEIYVRSCLRFNRYLKNKEKTKSTFRKGGWVKTEDIGVMDENQNIILKSRTTDVISRGTRKIFPASIESVVRNMTGIELAIVVGVPDKRLLEEVCVCYTTNKDFDITPDDVRVYCLKHFFQEQATDDGLGLMPKYFLELSKFPLLPNGKLDRTTLKCETAKRLFLS